jgi:uncharacterized membrane protein YtjA (UPF0391 family)
MGAKDGLFSLFQTIVSFSGRLRHGNRVIQVSIAENTVFVLAKNSKKLLENTMLGWALTFLVIALIAAALGFGGLAGTAAGVAKILFVVFLVLFVIGLVMGRRGPTV